MNNIYLVEHFSILLFSLENVPDRIQNVNQHLAHNFLENNYDEQHNPLNSIITELQNAKIVSFVNC